MKTDASAIANYFIQKGINTGKEVTMLKLLKLVYIAHGYSLALLNRSLLNPNYDIVEAWQYGPVVPSLYHTLKFNGAKKIDKTISIPKFTTEGCEFIESKVEDGDNELQEVLDFVWDRYNPLSSSDLIELLHAEGTPWSIVYKPHQNVVIPDKLTKDFYKLMIKIMIKDE